MFKKYGILGLLLIVFAQVNFFLKIELFSSWYFPIVWFGYILLLDAIVYRIAKNSLITNRLHQFLFLILLSIIFWWIYEFFNLSLGNWQYASANTLTSPFVNIFTILKASLSFATVLPAIAETYELISSIHFLDHFKLKSKHRITKKFLYIMIAIGIFTFITPILFSTYFFPVVWMAFFFILDPINYLAKEPSIISHLKDRKLLVPISLFIAGTITGFFWEFWNYHAVIKWYYNIPFIENIPIIGYKIFEMPLLGYLGYGPFAFSLYSMYHFTGTLHKEEKILEKKIKRVFS